MYDHLPRWYGLSWDNAGLAILVWVHRELLGQLKPVRPGAPAVQGVSQAFGFTNFVGDFTSNFGFDDALVRQAEGEYIAFRGVIPNVRCITAARCQGCRGRKKDRIIPGDSCYECDGTGRKHEYRWQKANALSASLGLLLAVIEYPPDNFTTTAKMEQFLTVRTGSGEGHAFIGGMYSIPFADWLRQQEVGKPLEKMISAMRRAYAQMMGESRARPFGFRASVDYPTGWLNVDVPGDGCGIHPSSGHSPEVGRGYEFSDHNVDHPAQQLALLAGLAALHDQVDRELYGSS